MRVFVNEYCGHPFQISLSRELSRRGHQVCHIYFADNDGTPKGAVCRRIEDPETFCIEGLRIDRCFSKYSLLSRRSADVAYGRVAARRMDEFDPDVVISANMPLDGQRILLHAARRRNTRFVFWLQDVYSEAVRFVVGKKSKTLGRAAGRYFAALERSLLRASDGIVSISPAFAERLDSWGVDQSKLAVIENWACVDEIRETPKDSPWSRAQGIADKFCFMYAGTLGLKHRPDLLLELARCLQERGRGCVVVVAAGAGAEWLKDNARSVPAEFLRMLPLQPYDRISEVLGSADVLLTLLDADAGLFAVPSKALSYLCAGRAQLVAAPSGNAASALVRRANAGVVVEPTDSREMIAAAELLMERNGRRAEFARNARQYAERNFNVEFIADRFEGVMEAACRRYEAHKGFVSWAASRVLR